MIYQCIKCPRFKTGQPHRSSATKSFLCDDCARGSVADKMKIKSTVEVMRDRISYITRNAKPT